MPRWVLKRVHLVGQATIRIPAGTQPGTIFRLRGKESKTSRAMAGDLHVRVLVKCPLDSTQNKRKS